MPRKKRPRVPPYQESGNALCAAPDHALTDNPAMHDPILVLGIESSCDETAAAVVRSDGTVLSSEVASQMEIHAAHGGVVPEIAARAHTPYRSLYDIDAHKKQYQSLYDIAACSNIRGIPTISGPRAS